MKSENLPPDELIEVDLKLPGLAAFWAWIWPGAGHIYQGRYGKGLLYMVCILGVYFFGLALGGGHCVYASWQENDRRWQYLCQVGVGLPALPAVVQNRRIRQGQDPLFGGLMAPPTHVTPSEGGDELADWHAQYPQGFELGTLYTMIAGLLNVLAIYDAFAGPVIIVPHQLPGNKKRKQSKGESSRDESSHQATERSAAGKTSELASETRRPGSAETK